jgi:predicted dienelactone hydrolase
VEYTWNDRNRDRDVPAKIYYPLSHRLDENRVAVAGHSFGAWTALAIAGETVAGKVHRSSSESSHRNERARHYAAAGKRISVLHD